METSQVFAAEASRDTIYYPAKRPGFVAWTTAFDYGDGRVGLSFMETLRAPNPNYKPPRLEDSDIAGAPVSYGSVFCGDPGQISQRVYMVTADNGATFQETGRCPIEEGSFCNVGFPDGRIVGMDVPNVERPEGGGILIRESTDGGCTWKKLRHLLPNTAPYLWRVRRLRDGTIVVLTCLYGTPWGHGRERATRNTMLPGESYLRKIQTFFLTSADGIHYSEPHYILPGTGAHEYDFVELPDGSLLFLAGDVQGTPVARQIVTPSPDGWLNGTLYGVGRGSPPDPSKNPQGGFLPETMVALPDGLLVGSRRNKPYSCSNDLGQNWYEIAGLPPSLYQPFMQLMPDGSVYNFGHRGGDQGFGQEDMYIGGDRFRVECHLPQSTRLTLDRMLAPDGSHFQNRFEACLFAGKTPVSGATLRFRFHPLWNADGSASTLPQEQAICQLDAVTDETGRAEVHAAAFDNIGDIHFSYSVDVVFYPAAGSPFQSCEGPLMNMMALRPWRENRFPYGAYFAEGCLFVSPHLLDICPELPALLAPHCGKEDDLLPDGLLPESIIVRLGESGVLRPSPEGWRWLHSVHAPVPLARVLPMADGDWYL